MIPLFYLENCENRDLPIRLRRQSLYQLRYMTRVRAPLAVYSAVTSRDATPYPPRPLKRRGDGAGREWGEFDFPMAANRR